MSMSNKTARSIFRPRRSVPVGYDVISAAKEEWNYLVGANLKA
ncbi:MAG: hypothetical protein Ct9H300mP7_7230 [Verrucomicrobiota bacterium]|nr:MAG: hypothetical protein Ct9H300mP7_7230 [Verrucomicrobiota bacterium]